MRKNRNAMTLGLLVAVIVAGSVMRTQRAARLVSAKKMLAEVTNKVHAAKDEYEKNRWSPELLADRSVSAVDDPPPPPGPPPGPSASAKLRSKAEFLPKVLRAMHNHIPESELSDELKVRTWEYNKVRKYWKKATEEGVVGLKAPKHSEPVFKPHPKPAGKETSGPISPHECRPAGKTCDELGDAARYGTWQHNAAECSSPLRWKRALCSIHNETWIPSNIEECGHVCGYSPEQACAILSRSKTVAVLGDSLMRQVYEAFTCATSGDYKYGSLKMGLERHSYKNCGGDHQFNERACLGAIEFESLKMPGPPCGGKVSIEFRGAGTSTEVYHVMKTLTQLNKTDVVVLGVGLWDKMNVEEYTEKFFKPLLKFLKDPENVEDMPQLIFLPPHAMQLDFGYKGCTAANGIAYLKAIGGMLQEAGVVVMDSINLTIDAQTESYDGMHYIGSVNYVKISLILRYLETGYLKQQTSRRLLGSDTETYTPSEAEESWRRILGGQKNQ